jgi:hypothetical protein
MYQIMEQGKRLDSSGIQLGPAGDMEEQKPHIFLWLSTEMHHAVPSQYKETINPVGTSSDHFHHCTFPPQICELTETKLGHYFPDIRSMLHVLLGFFLIARHFLILMDPY